MSKQCMKIKIKPSLVNSWLINSKVLLDSSLHTIATIKCAISYEF